VIPHLGDVGVSHGVNRTFVELAGKGFVTTASVMVTRPWFPEIAALAQERPELDLGVHLTLTNESGSCRWRAISTTARVSGLIDPEGFMRPHVPAPRRHAHKGAIEAECRTQIEAALVAGLDVTHLDAHMGAANSTSRSGASTGCRCCSRAMSRAISGCSTWVRSIRRSTAS
jgi:predicted glycoside hydrolase/deacetylase ChbG (UPF0249 family)